jgi:hypothetical protein
MAEATAKEPVTASEGETIAAGKRNAARPEGRGTEARADTGAEARTDTSAEAGSDRAAESWTERSAAEAWAHGGETTRAGAEGTPGESAAGKTGTPAEPATAEASMAPEAAAAEAAMTAAETTATEATASMTAAAAATTRRRDVSHRHTGQRGRGESQDRQFFPHRTLLARIAPHWTRFDPRLTPHDLGASGSRNRSQPRGDGELESAPVIDRVMLGCENATSGELERV